MKTTSSHPDIRTMRTAALSALNLPLCLLLSACEPGPDQSAGLTLSRVDSSARPDSRKLATLDTTTPDTLNDSVEAMNADLSPLDRHRFMTALMKRTLAPTFGAAVSAIYRGGEEGEVDATTLRQLADRDGMTAQEIIAKIQSEFPDQDFSAGFAGQ